MFTPCVMKTRPSASVMYPPPWPNGRSGAAAAVPAMSTNATAAATPIRIGGRLPHLAAWDVHLGRSLAGLRARPRAARRAAGLPRGLRDAPRRPRLADSPGGVCGRDRVDPDRHRRNPDPLAVARRHGPAGGDDRRDLERPSDARPRRIASGDGRELVWVEDPQARHRDARL